MALLRCARVVKTAGAQGGAGLRGSVRRRVRGRLGELRSRSVIVRRVSLGRLLRQAHVAFDHQVGVGEERGDGVVTCGVGA